MAVCSRLAMSPRAAPPVYCNGATPDNCVGKISPISSPSATTKCATPRSHNQLMATDGDLLPTAGELRLIYRPNNNRLEAQIANGNQTYEAIVIGAGFSGTRAAFPAFARARAKAVKTGG